MTTIQHRWKAWKAWKAAWYFCALFWGSVTSALGANADVGIVLMHGKNGMPTAMIQGLSLALQSKGYLVASPTMTWARTRIYDATFEQTMQEIDKEVEGLRQKGAKHIVVAGHSFGAHAALGFGAYSTNVNAIIALAPGHTPELPGFIKRFTSDVNRAKALIADGKGKDKQTFGDINMGKTFDVSASAEVYVSWFNPDGLAVMPKSAAAFKANIPLLFINGSDDPFAPTKEYIFDKAPVHPQSKFIVVKANHLAVPSAATEEVIGWLDIFGNK
jgi:pimeloyl-ACP methyl ester carboxylesterase